MRGNTLSQENYQTPAATYAAVVPRPSSLQRAAAPAPLRLKLMYRYNNYGGSARVKLGDVYNC